MRHLISILLVFNLFPILSGFNLQLKAQHKEIEIANQYYQQGEFEKAKIVYEKLSKKTENIPLLHANYLNTLFELHAWKDAEKYLKNVMKRLPEDVSYKIDYGLVLKKQQRDSEAKKAFEKVVNGIKYTNVNTAANTFIKYGLYGYAESAYLKLRKASKNDILFYQQLVALYILQVKTETMINELLNVLQYDPGKLNDVQNTLQNNLTILSPDSPFVGRIDLPAEALAQAGNPANNKQEKQQDYEVLESLIYSRIQKHPDVVAYNELLVWLFIQRKDFYNAFLQAKAIDKRNKTPGSKLMQVGLISFKNNDFENAQLIFQYIVKEYKNHANYALARRYLINTREEIVKNTYPVENIHIRSLINDYRSLLNELGKTPETLEALRNMAHLYAFYLDRKDTAVMILKEAISLPRLRFKFVAKCKLDLGDIYLLKGEKIEN